MCGIVGIVGSGAVAPLLVEGIARLQYLGCDSCGLATLNELGIEVLKDVGVVEEVDSKWNLTSAQGQLGIAHTRWATHGEVSQENAHPHLSCDRQFAVVHNGIISNYEKLKREVQRGGRHFFFSETDTEIITHLLEEFCLRGASVEEAFVQALRRLEGTFAVAMISSDEPEKIFCAREKSPLILGIHSGTNFVGSDINAFLPYRRQTVPLDDGEYAVVSSDGYSIRAISAPEKRYKKVVESDWKIESVGKGAYEHYMKN